MNSKSSTISQLFSVKRSTLLIVGVIFVSLWSEANCGGYGRPVEIMPPPMEEPQSSYQRPPPPYQRPDTYQRPPQVVEVTEVEIPVVAEAMPAPPPPQPEEFNMPPQRGYNRPPPMNYERTGGYERPSSYGRPRGYDRGFP